MKKFTSKKVKERASANNVTEINDFDMINVIENVQSNTIGDTEFCLEFTKAVFNVFGWRYYTTKELNEMEGQIDYDFTKQ